MTVCRNCASQTPEGTLCCPHCGARIPPYTEEEAKAYVTSLQADAGTAPQGSGDHTPDNRRKTRRIIGAFIVGAALWTLLLTQVIAPSTPSSSTPAPSIPAQPEALPPTATLDTSPEMQARRAEFIENCIEKALFLKVEQPATYPHVWVTPKFHALDFDDKQRFVSVVHAYYIAQDPACDITVLYDSKTGKKVGMFAEAYGGLKLE